MGEAERYSFGLRAGEVLRKIHTLPMPEDARPWGVRFRRKMQDWIDFYNNHDIKSETAAFIIQYLQSNQALPDARPQTFCHGDFWAGI